MVRRRKDRADGRPLDARQPPEVQQRGRHDRARVAGRHDGRRAAVLHQPHGDVDGGVALLADGLRRRFVHAYRLAGLDDVQSARLRRVAG